MCVRVSVRARACPGGQEFTISVWSESVLLHIRPLGLGVKNAQKQAHEPPDEVDSLTTSRLWLLVARYSNVGQTGFLQKPNPTRCQIGLMSLKRDNRLVLLLQTKQCWENLREKSIGLPHGHEVHSGASASFPRSATLLNFNNGC